MSDQAAQIKHIRKTGEMRADRRFSVRSGNGPRSRTNVNRSSALCGGETSEYDMDRESAARLIRSAQHPQLAHWTVGMCPACRSKLDI